MLVKKLISLMFVNRMKMREFNIVVYWFHWARFK
jgi:hypothetical protein